MINDVRSSKEARAKRLMSLRRMTRLSKRAFAKKYSIPIGNFQNWEGPRYGGLTEQGARRIIAVLRKEGIFCTLEWLMHGLSDGPRVTDKLYLEKNYQKAEGNKVEFDLNDTEIIAKELLLFRQHYGDTLELVVADDSMEPHYKEGEYLAGKKFSLEHINSFLGGTHIVETSDGEVLLRNIRRGNTEGFYNLVCTNFTTTIARPIIYDVEINSVAPISWVRRPLKRMLI